MKSDEIILGFDPYKKKKFSDFPPCTIEWYKGKYEKQQELIKILKKDIHLLEQRILDLKYNVTE